jgi:dipeptidyl aminopeptidase/acylaminoacyl peptidase
LKSPGFVAALAALCLCASAQGAEPPPAAAPATASGPPNIESFYAAPRLRARVSPGGRYVALVQRVGSKDRLAVIDLVGRSRAEIFDDPETDLNNIGVLIWKGDDRLVFAFNGYRKKMSGGEQKIKKSGDYKMGMVETAKPLRLYSIARTGGQATAFPMGPDLYLDEVLDPLRNDDQHILVTYRRFRKDIGDTMAGSFSPQLDRLDVTTGKSEVLQKGGDRTIGWAIDNKGQVAIRYDVYGRRGGLRVFAADGAPDRWKELFSIRERDVRVMPDLEILGFSSDPGKLYVAVDAQDRAAGDTRELRLYDFTTRTMGARVWANPKYDLDGVRLDADGALAAICYWADTYSCDYLDPERGREAKAISEFFDGDRNIELVSESLDGGVQVLSVRGPEEPRSLYLYDRKTRKVEILGAQWRDLTPDRLATRTRYSFKARDGARIDGYLTVPAVQAGAKGPRPMILLPHGGPEARDYFDYDRWAQIFATRGYLVFQPNFRGSGGYGKGFAEQGYGQWGLRMQDDVMDGVQALIDQGQADPKRICAVGASYGGYVALFAGAKRPDLFRCVISVAGVSDLIASQNWERQASDDDSPRYKYWLKSVGDPVIDKDRLKAASPVTYAKDYGPPVLLIHGGQDDIVPVEQSRIMQRALSKAGRSVKLIEYDGEGHPSFTPALEIAAMKEMLTFVGTAIGPP